MGSVKTTVMNTKTMMTAAEPKKMVGDVRSRSRSCNRVSMASAPRGQTIPVRILDFHTIPLILIPTWQYGKLSTTPIFSGIKIVGIQGASWIPTISLGRQFLAVATRFDGFTLWCSLDGVWRVDVLEHEFGVLTLTLLRYKDVSVGWDLSKQQLLGKLAFQHVLNGAAERTCTHGGVVAAFCQQFLGCLIQFDAQVLFFQTLLEATDKQVNNLDDF